MHADKLKSLQIDAAAKSRPQRSLWLIFLGVLAVSAGALYFGWPRASDQTRVVNLPGFKAATNTTSAARPAPVPSPGAAAGATNSTALSADDVVLTVSGYLICRERIAVSPRFMGLVKWIGVKKGDPVTNGQVVVLLDDTEYRARLRETEGRLANARVAIERAQLDLERISQLARTDGESRKSLDDARLALESARAGESEAAGAVELARTYLDWCTVRSPIHGVVLEKLVQPNELVMPQSFGGTRGPSTALIAVADPQDLQVEIDVNESDLGKVRLNQQCRVSPEAYPDHHYEGCVTEIAPEANRQKGTLQIKVQVRNPDRFLTPELSAKVEFLK